MAARAFLMVQSQAQTNPRARSRDSASPHMAIDSVRLCLEVYSSLHQSAEVLMSAADMSASDAWPVSGE